MRGGGKNKFLQGGLKQPYAPLSTPMALINLIAEFTSEKLVFLWTVQDGQPGVVRRAHLPFHGVKVNVEEVKEVAEGQSWRG